MKTIKIISLITIGILSVTCSNRFYRRGNVNYETMSYHKAISNYEKFLKKKDKPEAKIRLADSYRRIYDMPNAELWYSRVVELPEAQPVHIFDYARILMSMEKYDQAKAQFQRYLRLVPDDFVAEMLLASCNSVNTMMKDTTLYSVKEIEMPEIATAFGQIPYDDGIIFTADKEVFRNSKTYQWTGRSYLDTYFSRKDENGKWLNPMTLKGNINGAFHEGPACFSEDGNTVYFTRSNMVGNKLKKNSRNENNLKIYTATLKGEKWTGIKELPFNSDDYSCAHPALSEDGNTLYFVSDMSGGFGGADIYKSTFDGEKWSKPENLGPVINTAGNEVFPYMHSDGTFYFSSDSHVNLGGLDVFMTSFNGKNWLQVENLNYPVNSSRDDFSFVLNEDNKSGYLSSNRSNSDKMYEVTRHDPRFFLSGIVSLRGKRLPVDSAMIEVLNAGNHETEKVYTGRNGEYRLALRPHSSYLIKASKKMHYQVSPDRQLSTAGKKKSENFYADFEMEQLVLEKPIVLENIYYDFDKWKIRPDAAKELNKLVKLLKENPGIHIELSSHTDSRAGDQYNLVLSDKRAKAAVDYLVLRGIRAERLSWKGYGESKLVNRCKNGVSCSDAEHQQNRRTEFKVVKTNTLSKN